MMSMEVMAMLIKLLNLPVNDLKISASSGSLQFENIASYSQNSTGLDLVAFNSRFNFTVNYYLAKTKPIPPVYSQDSPNISLPEMQNRGFEITSGYFNKKGDFTYGINGNFSINSNKVTNLNGLSLREWGLEYRQPAYSFFGYQANGIIKTQADIESHGYPCILL